jgi:hypothetical protein|tara:strand:- start:343 stop:450 length:108 start_codon:yes stop_codon:yes gene_type:complete
MLISGWVLFGILILINTAIYVGIDVAFEKEFWNGN